MKDAVKNVVEGKIGYKLAAKSFSVPQTTLESLDKNDPITVKFKVPLGPKEKVFTDNEEEELCKYIIDMESRLYGLTMKDLRGLVYRLAVKNNKRHPFKNEKEEAGKDWALGFLKRHPELSIRQPESTSSARAAGFNKQVVDQFFNFLGNVYDEHHLTPDRIYNCDETGISVVPKTKSKIIARKGRKQVGAITSAERGTTITVEICFSASGNFMPPMMVYPRKRMDPQLMINAAPGAWGVCSDSGWMTSELFLDWFKKFVKFSGATPEHSVLLLLDGHSTHTKNIDLINEARTHGVIILCFPPHTTHRLQVADVAYMRPLSTYYDHQIMAWLRSNPGMTVTVRQVAEIFGKAFIQASTMSTAVNGFKKCGIWPYDPTVFSETDFAPFLMIDIQLNVSDAPASDNSSLIMESSSTEPATNNQNAPIISEAISVAATLTDAAVTPVTVETETLSRLDTAASISASTSLSTNLVTALTVLPNTMSTPEPGCSYWLDNSDLHERPRTPQQSIFGVVSPQQIMPFPATTKTSRSTRKRGKTAVITSSPYKNELEETIKKKEQAEEDKQRKKGLRELKKSEKDPATKKKRVTKKKQGAKNRSLNENSDSDIENTPCLYCKGLYLDSNEGWAACSACGKWAHCSCAGVDDEDADTVFTCEHCEQS
ncbi:unnamed protein product [Parnassius mnemosyne]|uniref:DDE-1 domain-containing protein n=1 Tax=Parnassius mnemosyne TaxID=213953 RepID=A0AAV1KJR7_9NEOP